MGERQSRHSQPDHAREYSDGYCSGFYEGGELGRPPGTLEEAEAQSNKSELYRAGFQRGFAAGLARAREVYPEQRALDRIEEEVNRLDNLRIELGGHFNEDERERWELLQKQIRMAGDKSWQDCLLELYRNILLFQYGTQTTATEEEGAALELVLQAVLERLAKTLLGLWRVRGGALVR